MIPIIVATEGPRDVERGRQDEDTTRGGTARRMTAGTTVGALARESADDRSIEDDRGP